MEIVYRVLQNSLKDFRTFTGSILALL
ncbi:MAG: hypothetical protein MR260_08900 [Spirochaetia bacterium]|nr:hypothetical protein [Spirochaetia bacterium]